MKVVILSLNADSVSAARLPKALRAAGFEVYVCAFKDGMIAASRNVAGFAGLDRPTTVQSVWLGLRLIHQRWRPDLIIPGDDTSVELLHAFALHDETNRDAVDREMMALIRASLGDPAQFLAVERKSALVKLGNDPTLLFPIQAALHEQDDLFAVANRVGYPLVLKRDRGAGGTQVAVLETEAALRTHATASGAFTTDGSGRVRPNAGTRFLIQRRVEGWNASVSFAALRGALVASFAYRRRCGDGRLGPTTVAERIDRDDLIRQAAGLVRRFGFTGLGGVDFVVEGGGGEDDAKADGGLGRVIEFNPRPTITTHLGALFGRDLCAALRLALAGDPVPPPAAPRHEVIALFPGEWRRDPESRYLETAHHDVPWDEPDMVKALLTEVGAVERPLFTSCVG